MIRKTARKANRALQTLKNIGKTEILVLGDSHAAVFLHQDAALSKYFYRVEFVEGATISGLQNPNSVTKALPIFEKAIKCYKGEICIILLGEVDTGFVIWYRANKNSLDVQEVLDQTVTRYIEFIATIPLNKHVIIVSAPLPTIQDGQDWGEIANARKEVTASQRERTELTLQLNHRMKNYSMDHGVMFIDLDTQSQGDNGLVNPNLLNTDRTNHHYDQEAYIKLLKPQIAKCVEQVGVGNVAPRRF